MVIIHNYKYIFFYIIYSELPMEMPILELIIPKKNVIISNGIIIILYEMEGYNIVLKFKVFWSRFPK